MIGEKQTQQPCTPEVQACFICDSVTFLLLGAFAYSQKKSPIAAVMSVRVPAVPAVRMYGNFVIIMIIVTVVGFSPGGSE
jgi:hypothetical protein